MGGRSIAWLGIALGLPLAATELSRAVVAEDDRALARLLAAGERPDEGEPRPLTWAARLGNVEAIRRLAKAGADLDRGDGGTRWTPIQHALHKRQAKAVAVLLDLGADPNRRAAAGPSPLMMAAGYGDLDSVEALLRAGADASFELEPGINALWAALGGGALTDITDGPPLGSCFPRVAARI